MNSFLKKSMIATAMVAFSLPVLADNRIRTEVYSENRVYPIYAKVGTSILVQLEADEVIKGESSAVGIGYGEAWKIGIRGNNIIFKPKAEQPVTNMLVVSNKRTYAFDLKMANAKYPATYILRFDYPDSRQKRQTALQAKQDRAFAALRQTGAMHTDMAINKDYYGRGNKSLAPTAIWDNGRFTYLQFNNGRDMPAVYRVEQDGSETLLNAHIENDTLVIHEVNAKLMLRLGKSVLLIENRGFNPQGAFNKTGTSDNETVRLIK